MNKIKHLTTIVLLVAATAMCINAATLPTASIKKLKGNGTHLMSAVRSTQAFFESEPIAASQASSPAASDKLPDVTMSGIGGWGIIEGPDGSEWFYSQTFTESSTNKYYYGSSVITLYDNHNNKMGEITVTVPDDMKCNQIAPFGKISRSFFERNTSTYEVMVYMHYILSPGVAKSSIDVYDSTGAQIIQYDGAYAASLISEGTSVYSMKERLALAYEYTDEDTNEDMLRFDILRKGNYSEGPNPVVDHSFNIEYEGINYSDGAAFNIKYLDGQFYYVIARYTKPYVASVDYATGNMTYTEGNSYLTEVYDQNYNKVANVDVPLDYSGAMPDMHGFGIMANNDLSLGYYSGDGKINVVITHYDYIVSTDSYLYSFDVYDAEGNLIKNICDEVIDWTKMGSLDGFDDQIAFCKEGVDVVQELHMINLPSCNEEVVIPIEINGKQISSNIDRVKTSSDSYKYVIGMAKGESDDAGNVISVIGWYNTDLTLDHEVRFNLGPKGEMFTPVIKTEYLSPYLFDTDDEYEYIFIAKIKRDDSDVIDNVLSIGNEDGSILRSFRGDSNTIGDYNSGAVLNLGTTYPSLFIAFRNSKTNDFQVEFYGLPFTSFAGGEGTQESPYLIATVGDMMQIANNPNAHFKLVNDIDMGSVCTWSPVDIHGGFDGNNHTICANIADDAAENLGLFGEISGEDTPAYVKDLSLLAPSLTGSDANYCMGALAGSTSNAEITNIYVDHPIMVWDSNYASTSGGIIGSAYQTTITNCSVSNISYNATNASGVGGIVGQLGNSSYIKRCTVDGTIIGRNNLGGIAGIAGGMNKIGSIEDCHADMTIKGENNIGGIAGSSNRILIKNCHASGILTASIPEYEDFNDPIYSLGGVVGSIATDWNGSEEKILVNCVALSTSLSIAENEQNPDKVYKGVHRVAGTTVNDLGMDGYTEAGIEGCYALKGVTIEGNEITSDDATSSEGATVETADKSFFEGIGFAYGSNDENPWVDSETGPYLYFEDYAKVITSNADAITLKVGEEAEISVILLGGKNPTASVAIANESIATVNNLTDSEFITLTVTGVAAGETTITVTTPQGLRKEIKVTVIEESGVDAIVADNIAIHVADNVVIAEGASRIELYSANGMRIAYTLDSHLNIAGIQSGIYIAVATDAQGNRTTKKFAKR